MPIHKDENLHFCNKRSPDGALMKYADITALAQPWAARKDRYEPLVDLGPGCNRDCVPTYWTATAGPDNDRHLRCDVDASLVVTGSGYTGAFVRYIASVLSNSELLAPFRRVGQRALDTWYQVKDEMRA